MEQLIKITEKDGKQAVSAKELHQFLEVETQPIIWCKRMFEYGFIDGVDYSAIKSERSDNKQTIKKAQSPRYDYQNLYNVNVFKACYPEFDYNFKD